MKTTMKNIMKTKGFTLIEVLIVLAILGVLFAGTSGMSRSYITNARVAETVDTLREGLMLAKLEAIKRNNTVDFTATANGSWTITLPNDDTTPNLEIHSKSTSNNDVRVADFAGTTNLVVQFTGTGRPVTPLTYATTPTGALTCKRPVGSTVVDGDITCKQVAVTSGGQVKVCNPSSDTEAYRC